MAPGVVAVVGGGQLARMMAPAAGALGLTLRVLVEAPDAPAAQVVPQAPVGAADDADAVRGVARGADALTFEHEHVPAAIIGAVVADGVPVRPSASALAHAQDKLRMRRRLADLGVPCPAWAPLPDEAALEEFALGRDAVVVKTARGGYDGKGVRVVRSADEVADWFAAARAGGPELLVEERVPFIRELAVLLARTPSGEIALWPIVETVQRDGVCALVIAPAPRLHPDTVREAVMAAITVAEGLDVTGVLAVEMFEVPGERVDDPARVVVNELAMRPHNSGHWTIEAAATSQFEQHLRAVLDLPLGPTDARERWTVMANVLGSALADPGDALADVLRADPEAHVHLYGKAVRPGRKLGHVTVYGENLEDVRARAQRAAALLQGDPPAPEETGWEAWR